MKRKIRLGVLFGGRSREHEVSVSSARSVIEAIDTTKYEVVPIGITKTGVWQLGKTPDLLGASQGSLHSGQTSKLVADVAGKGLLPIEQGSLDGHDSTVDVIFPLLHGPLGEDGTVQGMLELAGVAYVGAGVASSAIGMDKALMKAIFEHAGLEGPRYSVISRSEWNRDSGNVISAVENELGFPVFAKPARLGSSVGISKATTTDGLWAAISEALRYDAKVVVEQAIDGREIECGLLGNETPAVSVFGEIVSKRDFYDYEAKYTDGLAELIVPAQLSRVQIDEMTDIAIRAFKAIDARGMARVDFFLERGTDRVILNEINTIPGFTRTSMFPKLWEASGLSYTELIDRLVELALENMEERTKYP